jgi:hypothetical protein
MAFGSVNTLPALSRQAIVICGRDYSRLECYVSIVREVLDDLPVQEALVLVLQHLLMAAAAAGY